MKHILYWSFLWVLIFFSLLGIYISTGKKDEKIKNSYRICFCLLVICLTFVLGILYTFVPHFIEDNNIHTKYLGLLYLSISICALLTYYLKMNLDAYIIISSIWKIYLFFHICYIFYSVYLNNNLGWSWDGIGLTIPYFIIFCILLSMNIYVNNTIKCNQYD